MKYRSLFTVLIAIGILFSLSSCTDRKAAKIYDKSRVAPWEAARISVTEDIKIVSIDGRSIKSAADYILSTRDEIHVAPGEHEIVVFYGAIWDYGKKKQDHEIFNSKEIVLNFNAEKGGLYKLTHPELKDINEARKFAENPNIWIAKVGKHSDVVNEVSKVSHPANFPESKRYEQPEKTPVMENDKTLREEWYSLGEDEKEEFKKWLEWKKMSQEEKEKFREWTNKNNKE